MGKGRARTTTGNSWLRYNHACAVLMFLATFVFIYKFSCCENYGLQRQRPLPNPPHRGFRKRCANVLKSLTNGKWRLKTSVTPQEEVSRKDREMQMRVRKGWPQYLYHGDLRCGPRFPLPRAMNNNGSMFDIQGQCDPASKAFCCHSNNGWCGSGPEFCECPSCINYRTFISAELADWIPSSACHVKNFTQKHACNLLSRHLSSLVFIGDSLVRHLYSAMLLILTGDPLYGALRVDTPETIVRMCHGDSQFLDSMCQRYTIMRWHELASRQSFCRHRANFTLSFIQAYNTERAHYVLSTVQRLLNQAGAVVFLGIGIHNGFRSTEIIQNYLEPAFKLASTSTNGWPRIVWLATHSAGPLKPLNFYKHQSNHVILPYNKHMSRFCQSHGIDVFDTFNMTLGVHSFDGTHYGFGVNMLKAQVLLSFLEEEYRTAS